jgi:hypothetical protein
MRDRLPQRRLHAKKSSGVDVSVELAAPDEGGNRVASRPVSAGLNGDGGDGPDSALGAGWPSPDETGRETGTAF